jgi:hypothetical protein
VFQAASSRLLLAGWWLFGIAIVAAYAANLSAIWSLIDGTCVEVNDHFTRKHSSDRGLQPV